MKKEPKEVVCEKREPKKGASRKHNQNEVHQNKKGARGKMERTRHPKEKNGKEEASR